MSGVYKTENEKLDILLINGYSWQSAFATQDLYSRNDTSEHNARLEITSSNLESS